MREELLEKYLIETTFADSYPDTGGICGDDDFSPGNILMGLKYRKSSYRNRLTGYDKIWKVHDGDWKWDEFENSKGMENPDSYSDTLKKLDDVVPDFDFYKRLKRKVPVSDIEHDYDRTPQKRDIEAQLGKDDVETADVPDEIKEKIELYLGR